MKLAYVIVMWVGLILSGWAQTPTWGDRIVQAALAQVGKTLYYDPAYVSLPYPSGDVPQDRGVCSDVVVRACRGVELDLQQLVHEDMKRDFRRYPKIWGLTQPDKNIDHRRVPNLMTYFQRHHTSLPVTKNEVDYQSGDVVAWMLPSGLWHVGVVGKQLVPGTQRRLTIHNIGAGAQLEDVLWAYEIRGHYRIKPPS